MTEDRRTDPSLGPYKPDAPLPSPDAVSHLDPEVTEPREPDSDPMGGGGKMPLPKEGGGDPRERAP